MILQGSSLQLTDVRGTVGVFINSFTKYRTFKNHFYLRTSQGNRKPPH